MIDLSSKYRTGAENLPGSPSGSEGDGDNEWGSDSEAPTSDGPPRQAGGDGSGSAGRRGWRFDPGPQVVDGGYEHAAQAHAAAALEAASSRRYGVAGESGNERAYGLEAERHHPRHSRPHGYYIPSDMHEALKATHGPGSAAGDHTMEL
jgi:hypothetical protein